MKSTVESSPACGASLACGTTKSTRFVTFDLHTHSAVIVSVSRDQEKEGRTYLRQSMFPPGLIFLVYFSNCWTACHWLIGFRWVRCHQGWSLQPRPLFWGSPMVKLGLTTS